MPLVSILGPTDTETDLALFSFSHARDHDEIDAALLAKGTAIPNMPLDPIPLADGGAIWLQRHQAKHNAMNAALLIAGTDLTGFDLRQKVYRDTFVELNFGEHSDARDALGI